MEGCVRRAAGSRRPGGSPLERNQTSLADADLRLHSRLLAALDEAVVAIDTAGTITYWNDAAERLYGWRADEVVGRDLFHVMSPDAAVAQSAESIARLTAGGGWSGEFVARRRDGAELVVNVSTTPVVDETGRLIGVVGISQDLTERRELVELIQRFASVGSWEIDVVTGRTTWSDELFRILGLDPGQAEPSLENGLARVHPDDREAVESRIGRVQKTGEPVESVHRVVRPDGEVRWIHERQEKVLSRRNIPLKLRGTDLDITELRRAEEGLQAAELRFRSGFEQSPIGLALSTPEGRYMIVNPALCRLLGRSEAELRTLSFAQVSHPDDAERDLAAARRMLSGETQSYQVEKRYLRPDGEVVWVSLSTSLVRDHEGRPAYFFGQVQDITERRRAEQAGRAVADLRRSALSGVTAETLMDEVVGAVASCLGVEWAEVLVRRPSGDLVVAAEVGAPAGPAGSVVAAGADSCARYTMAGGEAVVVPDLGTETRFVPPPQLVERGLASALSVGITVQGRAYGALTAYSTEAGRFSAVDVPFVEAVGNVVGTVVERSHHDQQERLAAVGQLAAGVAHDFNNIVSAISLLAELIEAESDFDGASRGHLAAIRQQVERATALVWQVLDFARRSPIERVEVDLASFVAGLLPVLRRTLPAEVALTVADDGGPFLVRGDPTSLQQILSNLAINARDAIDGHGELTITLSRSGLRPSPATAPGPSDNSWVRIDVADNGSGMPPEIVERVFEPFFTTKPPGQGTGLGLAQVHGLVSQHGGHIEVDSSVGEGTTVSIWLRAADPGAGSHRVELSVTSRGTGERLLVVDDDDAVRSALGQVLESLGYLVTLAADGEEALAHLDEDPASANAVVSDVMMPGIGGEGLARVVAERWPAIPVVLISGNPATRAQAAGGVGPGRDKEGGIVRLTKPFSSNELAEAIQAALDSGS